MRPNVKYRIICALAGKYPIKGMCEFVSDSRSDYCAYRWRKDRPDRDLPLAEMIRECQAKREKLYIHLWRFCVKQVQLNAKTALRVMRKYGLFSEVRGKKYRYGGQHTKYKIRHHSVNVKKRKSL